MAAGVSWASHIHTHTHTMSDRMKGRGSRMSELILHHFLGNCRLKKVVLISSILGVMARSQSGGHLLFMIALMRMPKCSEQILESCANAESCVFSL